MTAWQAYWLFTLDSVGMLFCIVGIILTVVWAIVLAASGISGIGDRDDDSMALFKKALKLFPIPGIILVIATLIPSTKTMAAIIVLPKLASAENIEMVSKDAGDIYKLAMMRLKDALGED